MNPVEAVESVEAVEAVDLVGRTAIVTGGGHGIGRAFAEALAARGARVVVADLHAERAERIAQRVGGISVVCDVGSPDAVQQLVDRAVEAFGPVAVAVSNAGIADKGANLNSPVEQIRAVVDVNLLSHVWMAQAVLPAMIAAGQGVLIQTLSSAALITGPSPMGYTLTKHGALGFAEWVALHYAHLGIRVVALCPNAVNTGLLGRNEDVETDVTSDLPLPLGDIIEPELCASMSLAAMDAGQFLVLPHPRVGDSFKRKADDYDGWLAHTNTRLRKMRGELS